MIDLKPSLTRFIMTALILGLTLQMTTIHLIDRSDMAMAIFYLTNFQMDVGESVLISLPAKVHSAFASATDVVFAAALIGVLYLGTRRSRVSLLVLAVFAIAAFVVPEFDLVGTTRFIGVHTVDAGNAWSAGYDTPHLTEVLSRFSGFETTPIINKAQIAISIGGYLLRICGAISCAALLNELRRPTTTPAKMI